MDSSFQTLQSSRWENRSTEAEYAGPQTQTPPSSSESTRAAKRVKRSGGSSDSGETAPQPRQLVIEDYRVAGPIYLPLPVRRSGGGAERHQKAWAAGLENEVHEILSDHHFSQPVVNLQKLRTERSRASPRSAVYIYIKDMKLQDRAQWPIAANLILELCRRKGLDDLNVEIADPHGLAQKISATISPTLSIVHEWETLLPDIMNALKPNFDWLTIDLISRASWADFESVGSASFVPTILIMIKYDTEESYTAARDRIVDLLDPRFPEVAVEVIRGCASTQDYEPAFVHHGEKLWQEEAYMGASIRRAGSDVSGTLGCFIKLRDPQNVVRTYGLTNFHVVVPDHENIDNHDPQMQGWIKCGLPPRFGRDFQINMPSEIDLDAARDGLVRSIKDLEGEGNQKYLLYEKEYCRLVAEGEDPSSLMPKAGVSLVRSVRERLQQYREQINAIDARKNNLRLGRVFAGSGIRQTPSRQLMDWAIIAVDHRRIPAKNQLPIKICGIDLLSPEMDQIGSPDLHKRVFKVGRRSDETCGFVNCVETTMLSGWRYDKGKLVYDIGGAWVITDRTVEDDEGEPRSSGFFSDKGDSGSAVFNKGGEFVGLLFGGTYPERDVSYVTAAQDLVEDIKHITGAVEVTMLGLVHKFF
jgi:hypothetical protein